MILITILCSKCWVTGRLEITSKKEAIQWAWQLLTEVYGLPKDRLYVTVFEGDESEGLKFDQEAYDLWKEFIDESRILNGNKKDNFWEMGETGPCGPCSEIHIDLRSDEEIASVAKGYGAIIPFLRPVDLSDDFTSDKEVRNHFINWLRESEIETDYLCYLYATAPFITVETLEGCYKKLKHSNADSILTVTSFPYPILRALKINQDKTLSFRS